MKALEVKNAKVNLPNSVEARSSSKFLRFPFLFRKCSLTLVDHPSGFSKHPKKKTARVKSENQRTSSLPLFLPSCLHAWSPAWGCCSEPKSFGFLASSQPCLLSVIQNFMDIKVSLQKCLHWKSIVAVTKFPSKIPYATKTTKFYRLLWRRYDFFFIRNHGFMLLRRGIVLKWKQSFF